MKFLKLILDFYINTSIHVAVAVFSLVQITKLQLNISTNLSLDYFIFFGTIFGYNFLKYFQVFFNRIFTFKKNSGIFFISLISFFGMIFYFFRLSSNIEIEFLKIGLLILIYPFIRKYGFLKMIFVSFCLTLITVYTVNLGNLVYWFYLIQRFLIIFCLLIPLEICDLEIDSRTIITLPSIIGIQNLKNLGYCLLSLFSFLIIRFSFCHSINIVIAIVSAIAIFLSNEKRSKYFTNFWVESLPVFWSIFIFYTK